MSDIPPIRDDEKSVFEKPETLTKLWRLVFALCGIFALMNIVLAFMGKTHPHFTIDKFPVFYGVVGFLSFMFIILAGQHLRKILMREEGYYDGDDAKGGAEWPQPEPDDEEAR